MHARLPLTKGHLSDKGIITCCTQMYIEGMSILVVDCTGKLQQYQDLKLEVSWRVLKCAGVEDKLGTLYQSADRDRNPQL